MGKTASAAGFSWDALEKLLKNQQPQKEVSFGPETKYRNFVEFCQNLCFTGLHLRLPPGGGRLF